ncbi:hypothetical protein ZIOFF_042074 [Zingiber officinale]|uniref:BED-type domain-containing protein n=1 Tax=Zingiber officinale TaxID=94328 RepID=A0A8J5G7J1_ZINOF|nr:hypothetical protein ZIOFF_042074 [Zingiber officinale]
MLGENLICIVATAPAATCRRPSPLRRHRGGAGQNRFPAHTASKQKSTLTNREGRRRTNQRGRDQVLSLFNLSAACINLSACISCEVESHLKDFVECFRHSSLEQKWNAPLTTVQAVLPTPFSYRVFTVDVSLPPLVRALLASKPRQQRDTSIKILEAKGKKVADEWSHFKKIIRRNDKNEVTAVVAICNYCKTEVPAHNKTHENNDIDGHVKKCKKNPHNAVKSDSSQLILTQLSMNNALTPHIFCQKKLEDKVVAFAVKDEMTFRVVEGAGFV